MSQSVSEVLIEFRDKCSCADDQVLRLDYLCKLKMAEEIINLRAALESAQNQLVILKTAQNHNMQHDSDISADKD
jgi:hypothetical protein